MFNYFIFEQICDYLEPKDCINFLISSKEYYNKQEYKDAIERSLKISLAFTKLVDNSIELKNLKNKIKNNPEIFICGECKKIDWKNLNAYSIFFNECSNCKNQYCVDCLENDSMIIIYCDNCSEPLCLNCFDDKLGDKCSYCDIQCCFGCMESLEDNNEYLIYCSICSISYCSKHREDGEINMTICDGCNYWMCENCTDDVYIFCCDNCDQVFCEECINNNVVKFEENSDICLECKTKLGNCIDCNDQIEKDDLYYNCKKCTSKLCFHCANKNDEVCVKCV